MKLQPGHHLKIGLKIEGTGHVLFSLLDSELLAHGIYQEKQLIDLIAVGQFNYCRDV